MCVCVCECVFIFHLLKINLQFDSIRFVAIKHVEHNTIVFKKCSSTEIRHSHSRTHQHMGIHIVKEKVPYDYVHLKKNMNELIERESVKLTSTTNTAIDESLMSCILSRIISFCGKTFAFSISIFFFRSKTRIDFDAFSMSN